MSISKREKYVGGGGSRWWRFDRYEIRDGFIRPAAQASLAEFDPWRAYETREGHVAIPPYLELVNLVQDLPRDPFGQRIPVSQELESGLLEWCKRLGLLGLLPHEVSSARFGSSLFTRTGSGWSESHEFWEPGRFEPPENEIIRETVWGDLIHEADTFWYEYFPAQNGNENPPFLPLTNVFWQSYAEPLRYFLQVARFFANAIEVIESGSHQPVIEQEERVFTHDEKTYTHPERRLDLPSAIDRLNLLSKSVSPIVSVDDKGRFQQHWRSPSMLGYLAMQAVQELLGDRKIIRCDACPKIFASNHHRARFCSKLCADRQRKREQRKRNQRKTKARRRPRGKKS